MTSTADVLSLTGIYHADGSLIGELRYWVGARLGRTHCSLCDITHGSVREKPEWRAKCESLPVPFRAVHLDERTPEERNASEGHTPCVLAHTAGGVELLLGPDALETCAGDPGALADAIDAALAARNDDVAAAH